MCGRYTVIIPSKQELKHRFGVRDVPGKLASRYNAAPSQELPVITNEAPDRILLFRWGLIPHWAKDKKIGYKMINARAETITQKPSYRAAFKKRRCLVIADGFYEWQKKTTGKVPHRVMLKDEGLFGFAGLWDTWADPQAAGREIHSFTIITTTANSLVKKLHDRMPVILLPDQKQAWLDPDRPADKLIQLLKPLPTAKMKCSPVSDLVNSPKNDRPEVIRER